MQGNQDYRFGYQGKYAEADKETNWNSFDLRAYDPAIGRWMGVDPYGQNYSPYMGMGNDPVNRVDPDGGRDEYNVDKNGVPHRIGPKGGKDMDFYNFESGITNVFVNEYRDDIKFTTFDHVQSNNGGGGLTASQYFAIWGVGAAALENFSGEARLADDFTIRTANAAGRVFRGNQFVKTIGLAKFGRGLGVFGGLAGMALDTRGLYNYYHPTADNMGSRVSPGKYGADAVMTAVGIFGGPVGAGVSVLYFGIDAYYTGGVIGYAYDLGGAVADVQEQNPGFRSQQMFP